MGNRKVVFAKSVVFSYSTKILLLVSGVIYTYLIANYLGPSGYGIVSYYIALITSIINVAGIYFLQSLFNIFIPRSRSKYFFMRVLKWQYCLAGILFILVFVFSEEIAVFLHKEEFLFLKYAAFLLLLLPLYDSFVFLFRGFKFFGKVLKTEIVVSFMNLCFAFFLVVVLSFGMYGVIYARIISLVAGILLFACFFRHLHFWNRVVDMEEVKIYSYGAFFVTLFRSLSAFSFTVFVGMFLSPATLGMFYIAQKFVGYIVSSFHSAMSEAVVPFVVEDYKNKALLSRYLSYSVKLSIILSIFSVALLVFVGRPLLAFFLPEYLPAYNLIVLYAVVASLGFFAVLYSAYMGINRMDLLARIYFYDLIVVLVFSVLLVPIYGVSGAIFTLGMSSVVQLVFLLYYLKYLGLSVDIVIRPEDINYFLALAGAFCRRLQGRQG